MVMEKIERIIKMAYGFFKQRNYQDGLICPNEEELALFLEAKLSPDESKKIKEHILKCKKCSEVVSLFELKQELLPPSYLMEKAKSLVEDKNDIPLWLEAVIMLKENAFSVIKSSADILLGNEILPLPILRTRKIEEIHQPVSLIKDIKNIRIRIEISRLEMMKIKMVIFIQDKTTLQPLTGMRLSLFKEGVELESHFLKEGKVIFDELKPASYEIEVSQNLLNVGRIKLDLPS